MPLTSSAIKKTRVDARRTDVNKRRISALKTSIKQARRAATFEAVSAAYSALDRAVKEHLVHKNYADRTKAQLSKLAQPVNLKATVKPVAKAKTAKPSAKKTAPKATASTKKS